MVWMWEGQEPTVRGHWFTHVGPQCDSSSPLVAGVRPYVITGICAYVCLSQHAEFTPLGPWPCAQGASSSPAVRSRALTWPVPLAHSECLTRRAQRSTWPTFPWRPFCWAAALLSRGGAARAELLTPPLLSWCVKSPPFVRRHVPVSVRVF